MIPGEYILKSEDIVCNENRQSATVVVVNTGDRPVQVGSHFHFFEVNKQMEFDRQKAFGMRLNIAAGTAVRFEPGEEKEVILVAFGGKRTIVGFNNLTNGEAVEVNKQQAIGKAASLNFKSKNE
jgi:urease subunit beta